ncbi:MAG: DUF1778 domain-containing protein [Dehalococcoidia bacterium]|nr:DUF1778 domain-containing protein [Dehalococcoidia bacterium]
MTTQSKPERFAARLPADVKELLQRAADLSGRSLTDFVIESARAAATATIREREVMRLSVEDSRCLAEALINPAPPNQTLRVAHDDYRRFTQAE